MEQESKGQSWEDLNVTYAQERRVEDGDWFEDDLPPFADIL